MSDQNNQPFFNIQRVYLKDLSLEQPNSPAIFLEQDMPSVEVEVDVKADRLAESIFEVAVTGTVTAKVAEKVAFLIEAKQGLYEALSATSSRSPRHAREYAQRALSADGAPSGGRPSRGGGVHAGSSSGTRPPARSSAERSS
jgi:hypothetical protein